MSISKIYFRNIGVNFLLISAKKQDHSTHPFNSKKMQYEFSLPQPSEHEE
jgi:hypothetical protein